MKANDRDSKLFLLSRAGPWCWGHKAISLARLEFHTKPDSTFKTNQLRLNTWREKNNLATDGETLKNHCETEGYFKLDIAAQMAVFFSGLFHPSLHDDIKVSASLNFLIARTYFLHEPSAASRHELSPKQHDTTYCRGKMIIRRNIRAEEVVWKNALAKWSGEDCF